MKKTLSLLLLVILLLSSLSSFALLADGDDAGINNNFSDVPGGSWYESGVLYCYKYGYMVGMGDAIFNPDGKCTRAMFATVLYNISSASDTYETISFLDVPADTWYSNPVEWAFQNEYTYGVAEGYFAPNNVLSRQELVTLLYRYHIKKYGSAEITGDLSAFSDSSSVSDWATDAMGWSVGEGIISGFEDASLRPRGEVTRAQLASILKRYLAVYGIKWVEEETVAVRSCTEDGVSVFYSEGREFSKTVTYKAWHNYRVEEITQKYDCIYGEKARFKCVDCGESKVDVSRAGTGKHNWDSGKVITAPTLKTGGETLYTCSECGGTFTKKVPALSVSRELVGNWYSNQIMTDDNAYHNLTHPISASIVSTGRLTCVQSGGTYNYDLKYYSSDSSSDYYRVIIVGDGTAEFILAHNRTKNSFLLVDNYGVAFVFNKR